MSEQLVIRTAYRAELNNTTDTSTLVQSVSNLKSKLDTELLTVSLFQWQKTVFLYIEDIETQSDPNTLLQDANPSLSQWPGGQTGPRHWVPMMDIFHYNQIKDVDQWRRKEPVETAFARVIYLRPEMVSSYIFYHYQLQEERPGFNNKYGIITMHENLLFFYQEKPSVVEPAPFPGKLKTQNTPSGWQELMGQHFQPWTDPGEEIWRPIDLLISIGL